MFSPDLQKAEEYLSMAQQQLQLGNDSIAAEWFDRAASIFRNLKRYEEAIAAQEKAVEIRSTALTKASTVEDSNSLEYFESLAATLKQLGRFEEAIAAQEKALQIRINMTKLPEAGFWLNQGNQQFSSGDFEKAIASYDAALRYQPDNHETWCRRGVALWYLGRYDEAVISCDMALRYKPDYSEAWTGRGLALKDLGRYEEALKSYNTALRYNSDNYITWMNRGGALVHLGRHEEAIASSDTALRYKPDDHDSWRSRGIALWSLGRYNEAITSYDMALRYKPDYSEAWGDRGLALYTLEQYEEALASYDAALRYKPDNHGVWHNRGITLRKLGRYEEAITSHDTALRYKPDYSEAWTGRAIALSDLVRYEEALTSFDTALSYNPHDQPAWCYRGAALAILGCYEEAIVSYDTALHYKRDDHEVWSGRGVALWNLGRYEEAIISYDTALHYKPDFHDAWRNRGLALHNIGCCEEALVSYDTALHYKPDFHDAWRDHGVALWDLGRYEEAIISYDTALHYKPDFHDAWFSRGLALWHLGRYDEAIVSCDMALCYKPDYSEAWINRGLALKDLGWYEEAISSYDTALRYKSDNDAAWSNRGGALVHLERYEEAITSLDEALHYKPDSHDAWRSRGIALWSLGLYDEAITDYDMALRYKPDCYEAWCDRGLALCSLGRYEEAISNFDKALSYQPDYYRAWCDRGIAAANSDGRGKRPLVLSFPSSMQSPALDLRGYEGQLASLREGFKYVAEGSEGWGLLHYYIGNAQCYEARRTNSGSLWHFAESSYKDALDILTAEHFPEHHLNVLGSLITVLYVLQETDEAKFLQREGSTLIERLQSDPKCSPNRRKILQAKQATFAQISVDLALALGDKIEAFNLAERGKNTCLRWMLNIDQLPLVIYDQVQRWIPKATAMLYWHISPNALTTFVILPNTYEPIVVPAPPNPNTNASEERSPTQSQIIAWENWLTQWNNDYQSYTAEKGITQRDHPWRNRMSDRLSALKDILNISEIEAILSRQSITQMILVPHRDLHCFPLHTFFTLPCTYLPSAYFGINAQPNPISLDRILLIENPKNESVAFGGGTFIEIESALIQAIASTQAQVIDSDAATLENVESALSQSHHILHFTGHAAYNSRNPKQSCLFLAGRDQLSLQTLAHLDLSSYHLISLAACETGVTGKQTITAEYVGLPSAFLKANASRILSTFWRVESVASMFFVVEFYRSLQSGMSPTIALQHTQTFLKTATRQDLITWIDAALSDLPESCQIALRYERDRLVESKIEHPYDHPYYWAAFSITGL